MENHTRFQHLHGPLHRRAFHQNESLPKTQKELPRLRFTHPWSPFGFRPEEERTAMTGESSPERLESIKRCREHHTVIVSSSQDESDHDCTMDCSEPWNDRPQKRFCFRDEAPTISPLEEDALESSIVIAEEDSSIHSDDHPSSSSKAPIQWWKKPTSSTLQAIVEKETMQSSPMDTSDSPAHLCCCHICQRSFVPPLVSSTVKDVMPTNALLNYFSPIGDVSMGGTKLPKPPSACACCDRSTCLECQTNCYACGDSFCSFCTIAHDETTIQYAKRPSYYCLDCYDRRTSL